MYVSFLLLSPFFVSGDISPNPGLREI